MAIALSPQCANILSELSIAPRTTLELQRACGMITVGTRIHELRAIGYDIKTTLVEVRNRHRQRCHVAQYSLKRRRGRPVKARASR